LVGDLRLKARRSISVGRGSRDADAASARRSVCQGKPASGASPERVFGEKPLRCRRVGAGTFW
jgi:hypothetical protein